MKLVTKGEVQRKIASLQASKNTVINNFINKLIYSDFYDFYECLALCMHSYPGRL